MFTTGKASESARARFTMGRAQKAWNLRVGKMRHWDFLFNMVAVGATLSLPASAEHSSVDPPVETVAEGPAQRSEHAPDLSSEDTRVRRVETGQGFIFHPSRPELHAFRFGLGGLYDAVDPQVMYGFSLRVPQVTLDARYGLGAGWSLKGHLNSMFVANELLFGASFAWGREPWSFEGSINAGLYYGKLANFGFDAALLSPEYRPELTAGYDFGNVALSLRGSLIFMGPERARVGDIWGGLDNANLFVGHSEMIYVENVTSSGGVWYFGLGAMTTRAYYQMWLLFPDSPALFTYARTVGGYEF
jgi:hypothetical protein